jgi:hypothetical protein
MFDLLRKTFLGVTAALTLGLSAADAATIDPNSNVSDGGSYDILAASYFYGITFTGTDGAGSFEFEFTNTSATSATVGVTIGTVLQFTASFSGGVIVEWLNGQSVAIPGGTPAAIFNLSTVLGAGLSDTLRVTYGDPTGGGIADIDLSIAAVPLPAGGLLLLGALGGLVALRRRKTAA